MIEIGSSDFDGNPAPRGDARRGQGFLGVPLTAITV
jgi:hypothetical protein